MKLIRTPIPMDCNLYLMGDEHIGSIFHYNSGHHRAVEMIANDPIARCVLKGDSFEAITVDDPRYDFDATEAGSTPMKQCDDIIQRYKPISSKILAICDGNHAYKLHKIGNITRDIICRGLFKSKYLDKYGTFSCKITYTDKKDRQLFKGFHTHGRHTFQSSHRDPQQRKATQQRRLKQVLFLKASDCIIMSHAHAHQMIVTKPNPELYLYDDGKEHHQGYTNFTTGNYIEPELRWYCCTASFMRLYAKDGVSGYAERGSYNPVELGMIRVVIRDGKVTDMQEVLV